MEQPIEQPKPAVRSSKLVGDSDEVIADERKKWMVVVVMGDEWRTMMGVLRSTATQVHIDSERSGNPSPWSVSGEVCYWTGAEGGRPSLDEIERVVESAKSPNAPGLAQAAQDSIQHDK